jgi:hypothetical protein
LLDSAPDQTQRTQRAQREANWSIQRRYTKSKTALGVRQRLDVQEVVEPHVGQLFLDGVLPQAGREVGKSVNGNPLSAARHPTTGSPFCAVLC